MVLDVSLTPARWIASVCDRFDLHPSDPAGAMGAGEQQAGTEQKYQSRGAELDAAQQDRAAAIAAASPPGPEPTTSTSVRLMTGT